MTGDVSSWSTPCDGDDDTDDDDDGDEVSNEGDDDRNVRDTPI